MERIRRDFRGKRVLIMGLGLYPQGSGAAAVRFFAAAGARVTVTDKKSETELTAARERLKGIRARFVLGGHRLADIDQADIVVQNPAVPQDSPYLLRAREKGLPVVSDIALFFRYAPARIIGVTGTRGKSTTSALLAAMIKADGQRVWLGGNIKVSPLSFLPRLVENDLVVLELSSWMLESLEREKASPPIAVMTNLYRDHLNTYPDMAAYARAKEAIFLHQREGDWAVLSYDNDWTRRAAARVKSRRLWTSIAKKPPGQGVFIQKGQIIVAAGGQSRALVKRSELRLRGEHNLSNALLAVGAASALGVSRAAIKRTLKSFGGLPDRLELVAKIRGVEYINDTTATTPEAVIAALRTMSPRAVTLIAGGTDKELLFGEMAGEIIRRVKLLILLPGSATEKLMRALRRIPRKIRVARALSMAEAVRIAAGAARRGETVLLSPGAASFGLFQNEFDRGEKFRREVKKIWYRG